ncbi:PrpF domain-containing protein [Dactylosporangium sp. CA-233914]|uniref:PrpF domain-containing protein n=1 Tax=Dactylosporangium sp. CA-233914 TaxID=3239934 RepID=UPI003D93C678
MSVLEGALVRGGTSKCWIFSVVAMDRIAASYDEILAFTFGGSDAHELDGVGGGTSVSSKAAIVGRSPDDGADVEYLFAQVGLGTGTVEWVSNCGNCATAVGLYAVGSGLVPIQGDVTVVRLRNRNTGAILVAEVETPQRRLPDFGTARVPGVTTTGVGVGLRFTDPEGSTTGVLLPTGRPVQVLDADGAPRVTLIDAGTPSALFDARDFPPLGTSLDTESASRLIALRPAAAVAMGLSAPGVPSPDSIPKVGVVGPPVDYVTTAGEVIPAEAYDIRAWMISMRAPHPAIGLTAAVAVATAAVLPGSVCSSWARSQVNPLDVRIGTPSGLVRVALDTTGATGDHAVGLVAATLRRAARVIARAQIQLPYPTHSDAPARKALSAARTTA